MKFRHLVLVPLLTLLPLSACSSDGQELTVVAAASLTETFEELATEFEKEHDGVEVTFSFGSSTTLAEQAIEGAPGDVLATADEKSMLTARDGDALAKDPTEFATNRLVIVVPAGNPAQITGLADLAGTDWVRCDDEVPCGRLALTLLSANQVAADPVSREIDVKATLAKVVENEADAGLVYATDAASAGDAVETIEIAGSEGELNRYFITPLVQDDSDGLAQEWIDFLASETGQRILTEAGFGKPE
ncbi:molybdate ABC transporter substrate-binding protein [Nocardioides sp. AE5]|uniref:molybdate ABC transporter substrate-binding protein n=1 Tax=Nocardioides sp. AE5 TaxID=2962573 RepID=UPI0028822EE8|nr:molybdate ABC transporter substrate-binding protein [Nocardioides sp. AE5]MDT0202174.1 molybdate ABC transporter substrate-binding protein [Nocardioides sp. AE5]